jgi:FlaA1/EpsC-like NDP-sugar epimerase
MRQQFPKRVRFVLGDIRDRERIMRAVAEATPERLIHAAAMKHVATGEDQPEETVKTNIVGTQNVVDACVSGLVDKAVMLSTDKACEPVNLYGASKMVGERLWMNGNRRLPIFNAVRYGNVIGSSGSVLHVFNTQKDHGVFRITDRRMTRFAVTFDYAINLVLRAMNAPAGETLVSKVPAFKVLDLAAAFDPDAKYEEIGIQQGEKLHESLLTPYERARSSDYGQYWVLPIDTGEHLPDDVPGYSSDQGPFMTVAELREMVNATL